MAFAAGNSPVTIAPAELADSLGFESIDDMCDWLGTFAIDDVQAYLAPLRAPLPGDN